MALLLPIGAFCTALWTLGCAQTPGPGMVRGEQIFDTCFPCHGHDGLGNALLEAPAIAGLPRWYIERQLTNFSREFLISDFDISSDGKEIVFSRVKENSNIVLIEIPEQ